MSYQANSRSISVWDPLIRIFHWSLAGFFVLAYATGEEILSVHSYAGYAIGGLLLFRVVWGIIGTPYARFRQFVPTPSQLLDYLKGMLKGSPTRFIGHNPAGAAMIIALMLSLLATLASGLVLLGMEGQGPLAQTGLAFMNEHLVEEAHEVFANLTVLLVAGHILGVLFSSLIHRENLVRSMITGRKPAGQTDLSPSSGTKGHESLPGEQHS